jgi:hypothetical protein
MPSEVIIIYSRQIYSSDLNFIKLAIFYGLEYRLLNLNDFDQNFDYLFTKIHDADPCIALSGETLSEVFSCYKNSDNFRNLIFSCASYMFVYGMKPGLIGGYAINHLTNGVLGSLEPFGTDEHHYVVTKNCKNICRQFSGLSFGPINRSCDYKFSQKDDSSFLETLISIDDYPFFIKWEEKECQLFLIATNRIVNINKKITESIKVTEYFSQIIPSVMFYKYVFGDMCWHSENSHASFIIDDPLLKRDYGFLNYKYLLKIMDEIKFHTSIGFIPYNYKRSDSKIASIFTKNVSKYSISIHGCNHTKREFGIHDFKAINTDIKLAKERMLAHQRSTKVKHDNVMIFPQGVFSRNSMKLLKANNFLAAVNTTTTPVDESDGLEIHELLNTSVMKFGNFPLFLRRYPFEYLDFVFDMFIGKPVLIVQHHDYFREGYGKLIDFINHINSVEQNLQWHGLGYIIKNTYKQRKRIDGSINVRIFANNCIIKNKSDRKKRFFITKNEDGEVPIKTVKINKKKISEFNIDNKIIYFSSEIEPMRSIEIEIVYKNGYGYLDIEKKGYLNAQIFIRRYLSEIRDNYVSKSETLASITKMGIKGLKKAKNLLLKTR